MDETALNFLAALENVDSALCPEPVKAEIAETVQAYYRERAA